MLSLPVVMIVIGCLFILVLFYGIRQWLLLQFADISYKALNSSIQTVYGLLFRNHILTHQLNNMSLSSNEMTELKKQFVKMVYETLGPAYSKRLIKLHGNKKALDMYLLLTFESLVDTDLAQDKE